VTELTVAASLPANCRLAIDVTNYYWEPQTLSFAATARPSKRMNGVVSTEPIDLTGRTETFSQRVKLSLQPGYAGRSTDVTVTVEIEADPGAAASSTNIPVQPQGLDPADFNITIQPQTSMHLNGRSRCLGRAAVTCRTHQRDHA